MAFFFLNLFTFVMFFQPVAVFPFLEPYHPYRYSAYVALITFLFFGKKAEIKLLSNKNVRYFLLFVAAQVASSSVIWLHGGWYTFRELWLNLVIIYFLIAKSCINERKIKWIIFMIVAGVFYLSYYSIGDFVNHGRLGYRALGFGWYENGNDLVFILVTTIPLAFYLAESSPNIVVRYLLLGVCSLYGANILLTGSREGLLGLLAIGPLSVLGSRKMTRVTKGAILALIVVSSVTIGLTTIMSRKDLAPGQLTGDASSENRIVQWKACLRMVRAHPLFGVGPGESAFAMRDYGGVRGLVPHNTLIQVFAETGIPGGILFVMCTIYPLWEAWKFFRSNRGNMDIPGFILYRYLIISLFGLWVCAFFSNRVYFKILYVLIALITALRENIIKEEQDVEVR